MLTWTSLSRVFSRGAIAGVVASLGAWLVACGADSTETVTKVVYVEVDGGGAADATIVDATAPDADSGGGAAADASADATSAATCLALPEDLAALVDGGGGAYADGGALTLRITSPDGGALRITDFAAANAQGFVYALVAADDAGAQRIYALPVTAGGAASFFYVADGGVDAPAITAISAREGDGRVFWASAGADGGSTITSCAVGASCASPDTNAGSAPGPVGPGELAAAATSVFVSTPDGGLTACDDTQAPHCEAPSAAAASQLVAIPGQNAVHALVGTSEATVLDASGYLTVATYPSQASITGVTAGATFLASTENGGAGDGGDTLVLCALVDGVLRGSCSIVAGTVTASSPLAASSRAVFYESAGTLFAAPAPPCTVTGLYGALGVPLVAGQSPARMIASGGALDWIDADGNVEILPLPPALGGL